MRKILFIQQNFSVVALLPFILLFVFAAHAQNRNQQSSSLCESQVGASGNQLTSAWGNKTNLWYDKDINTLVLVHCYDNDTSSVIYSYSTNQGATWVDDTMLYHTATPLYSGRFPQGVIYNPPGNTNPSNAYVACFGSTTDGTNWNAHYEGTASIGSSTNQQTLYPFTSSPRTFVPQGGTIVKNTGTTWWSAAGTNGTIYNDTIVLAKGIFVGNNFNYTYTLLPVPVCADNNGNKMFRNQAVIFDDSGQLGYVVVIGNDWVCASQPNDSTMGLIVYETTNSGSTWNRIPSPDLSFVDPVLQNNGSKYSAATQLDLAMDQNNTLHIGVPIIQFNPGNAIDSIYSYGTWGLFDINTSNHGADYNGCLISKPETGFGYFGTWGIFFNPFIREENRFQLSRSWDGDKIFYTWFDTDTAVYGSGPNFFPDIHVLGVDLNSGFYTSEENLSELSGLSCDGASTFGNVSYYTMNDGTNENIPIVIDVMTNSTGDPVQFYYEGCASMYNYSSNISCLIIPSFLPSTGIQNPAGENANLFSLSPNYPNPFSNKTSLDITLGKATDVLIEIKNIVGQTLFSSSYKKLHSGKNTITIDGSSFSKGFYFYTVKTESDFTSRKMSVE